MCVVLGSARGDLLNSKRGSGEGEEGEMRGWRVTNPAVSYPDPTWRGVQWPVVWVFKQVR